jgi:hypothetical protein
MRRLFTVAAAAVALSIPASVAGVGLVSSGSAFAASSITCSSLKGTISGNITIGKCLPSGGKGYKSASALATSLATGGTLTWSNSGATTTVTLATTSPGQGSCKKGNVEFDATGTVTAASTTGVGIPAVGDSTSARACVETKNGKITLVKGTTFTL